MADTKTVYKSLAEAIKDNGGEANVLKILAAHKDNKGARTTYQNDRKAILAAAKAAIAAGTLKDPRKA